MSSAMEKLMGQVIGSALPPELRGMLTPENLANLGNQVTEKLDWFRDACITIANQNNTLITQNERQFNLSIEIAKRLDIDVSPYKLVDGNGSPLSLVGGTDVDSGSAAVPGNTAGSAAS